MCCQYTRSASLAALRTQRNVMSMVFAIGLQMYPMNVRVSHDQWFNFWLQTLEVYPHSGQLLGMLAECEQRAHTLSRLRLHLRSLCKEKSSAMLWLMAIKAEAMLPAGSHRVQASIAPSAFSEA